MCFWWIWTTCWLVLYICILYICLPHIQLIRNCCGSFGGFKRIIKNDMFYSWTLPIQTWLFWIAYYFMLKIISLTFALQSTGYFHLFQRFFRFSWGFEIVMFYLCLMEDNNFDQLKLTEIQTYFNYFLNQEMLNLMDGAFFRLLKED